MDVIGKSTDSLTKLRGVVDRSGSLDSERLQVSEEIEEFGFRKHVQEYEALNAGERTLFRRFFVSLAMVKAGLWPQREISRGYRKGKGGTGLMCMRCPERYAGLKRQCYGRRAQMPLLVYWLVQRWMSHLKPSRLTPHSPSWWCRAFHESRQRRTLRPALARGSPARRGGCRWRFARSRRSRAR